jgi:hypothetical protein
MGLWNGFIWFMIFLCGGETFTSIKDGIFLDPAERLSASQECSVPYD